MLNLVPEPVNDFLQALATISYAFTPLFPNINKVVFEKIILEIHGLV